MGEHDEDSQIEGAVQEAFGQEADYPQDLLNARRASYKAQIARTKKPGCRLFAVMLFGLLGLAGWAVLLLI